MVVRLVSVWVRGLLCWFVSASIVQLGLSRLNISILASLSMHDLTGLLCSPPLQNIRETGSSEDYQECAKVQVSLTSVMINHQSGIVVDWDIN